MPYPAAVDSLLGAVVDVIRTAVVVPAGLLWLRGRWGRMAAVAYVVVPIAASMYVAIAVTPSPLPWGWLPYGILLIWGINLLDLLVQAIGAGLSWLGGLVLDLARAAVQAAGAIWRLARHPADR
jgi:hypothetical protein